MTIPQEKAISDDQVFKCGVGTVYALSVAEMVVSGAPLYLFTATGAFVYGAATMIILDLGKKINELEQEHFKA